MSSFSTTGNDSIGFTCPKVLYFATIDFNMRLDRENSSFVIILIEGLFKVKNLWIASLVQIRDSDV